MVEIVTVETKKQLREFVSFPTRLYKDVWQAVPDLYSEEMAYMTPKTNPAYDYCETKLFLAVENGRTVGRIAAILNNKYNEKTGEKRMRFSRFDVEDNAEAAAGLLGAVEDFAREKGMERVHGPIGFSDLDKQGMLVEGYELPDTSITLYNHPYYNTFMDQNGYSKEVDWIEFLLEANEQSTRRVGRIADRVLKLNGARLLEIKKFKDIKPRVGEIFELINTCYAQLYGTTPLTKKMQDYYLEQYFKMLNFDYVSVCVDRNDKIAAFALAFPSLAKAFKKSNGKLFPLGFLRILHAMRHTDTLELALIAVRPDLQGKGFNAVVCNEVLQNGVKNGVRRAETGPMLETNDKIQSQWLKMFEGHYTQHKRRRCYVKQL